MTPCTHVYPLLVDISILREGKGVKSLMTILGLPSIVVDDVAVDNFAMVVAGKEGTQQPGMAWLLPTKPIRKNRERVVIFPVWQKR